MDYRELAPQRVVLAQPVKAPRAHTAVKRHVQHAVRRAQILANARRVIVEGGYENLEVRTVALRSGVSTPTVYNVVGNRAEVQRQAVCDLQLYRTLIVPNRAEKENVNPIHFYADTIWLEISRYEAYSRQTMRGISLDDALSARMRALCEAAILEWLEMMFTQGRIHSRDDFRYLSRFFHRHTMGTVRAWVDNAITIRELRSELALGIRLPLLAFLESSEAARMDDWLARSGIAICSKNKEGTKQRGARADPVH